MNKLKKTIWEVPKELTSPYDIYTSDFRQSSTDTKQCDKIKVISWNLERGYKKDDIITELKNIDADILILQELDIGCERTNFINLPLEIAKSLSLSLIFVPEFKEFSSPIRPKSNQGGGIHGNALLTKFNYSKIFSVKHTPVFDWNEDKGMSYQEPREGGRVAVGAIIDTPLGQILTYSTHLEPFGGCKQRQAQIDDVLKSAQDELSQQQNESNINKKIVSILIGGDFNTMLSGIGRLSFYFLPLQPTLSLNSIKQRRLHHFGHTEAECLDQHIRSWVQGKIDKKQKDDDNAIHPLLQNITDPFNKNGSEWTYSAYNGLFQHKLDFIYYSPQNEYDRKQGLGLRCIEKNIGTGKESDHQFITISLAL
ncbi:MAG: hypothetical protein EZS28_021213 [Streblomastix strix]|uniref:Endonuclease/exonuclease/phosphatase domain-containing protein n=1 Tax=Streblomastix strix TaxID=222440 RepID=A0A5J4VL01_9EUKA|nr:MAG: hypothetical protein EZS28_021213 [Streblomastix strix]